MSIRYIATLCFLLYAVGQVSQQERFTACRRLENDGFAPGMLAQDGHTHQQSIAVETTTSRCAYASTASNPTIVPQLITLTSSAMGGGLAACSRINTSPYFQNQHTQTCWPTCVMPWPPLAPCPHTSHTTAFFSSPTTVLLPQCTMPSPAWLYTVTNHSTSMTIPCLNRYNNIQTPSFYLWTAT